MGNAVHVQCMVVWNKRVSECVERRLSAIYSYVRQWLSDLL